MKDKHELKPQPAGRSSRRAFIANSIATLPVMALTGCEGLSGAPANDVERSANGLAAGSGPGMSADWVDRQHARWLASLAEQRDAEAAGDLGAVVDTFTRHAELVVNNQRHVGRDAIRRALSETRAAFAGYTDTPIAEHFGDRGILVEGAISGQHVAEIAGFPATQRALVMPYTAVYRFDWTGKVSSKRMVVNYGVLGWFEFT